MHQSPLFSSLLKSCLILVSLYTGLVTDTAAQGYDILEVSPPPGSLARRAWLADKGVTLDIRYMGFNRDWYPAPGKWPPER